MPQAQCLRHPGTSRVPGCGRGRRAATQPGLSPDDLCAVTARTLVLTGGHDLATLDHTLALYRALPAAELAVLPNASHLLLMEHGGGARYGPEVP